MSESEGCVVKVEEVLLVYLSIRLKEVWPLLYLSNSRKHGHSVKKEAGVASVDVKVKEVWPLSQPAFE